MRISKNFINILFTTFFTYTSSQHTSELNATVPEFKGLYTLFNQNCKKASKNTKNISINTIGIGQLLLHSNWIENIYTYAPEDNPARKVVSNLWFKHLEDKNKNFIETDNFTTSEYDPVKSLKASDIGKIIKYIRFFEKSLILEKTNRENLLHSLSIKGGGPRKRRLEKLITALEELKYDNNFIPEMAECILWAFFENKTNWGEQELKSCLEEIDQKLLEKLKGKYSQEDFYILDTIFKDKQNLGYLLNPLCSKDAYDKITYYIIKSTKTNIAPTEVLKAVLQYKNPKTNKLEKEFPTCFESAILDLISILIYDQEKLVYNPDIMPDEIKNSDIFKKLINQVFKNNPKDKEFILAENINTKIYQWINLVTNLPELEYNKNNNGAYYDLKTCFENFVKILNKFFNLNLKEKDLTFNYSEINSWNKLFKLISKKLSTNKRNISIEVEKNKKSTAPFRRIFVISPFCVGEINITCDKTKFKIIINNGHAYIVCPKRDESYLYSKKLKKLQNQITNKLTQDLESNENLIPLLIFLPYMQIIKDENNTATKQKINHLLFYCLNLRDNKTTSNFLNKIFNNKTEFIDNIYTNKNNRKLINKLINKLPERDTTLLEPLIFLLCKFNNFDKTTYWKPEIISKLNNTLKNSNSNKSYISINLFRKIISIATKNKIESFDPELKKIINKTIKNPNIKNIALDTPLHTATRYGCIDAVKIILEKKGLDIYAKNKDDKTAKDLAEELGHKEISEILEIETGIEDIKNNWLFINA
ncbi:MAG: hypothetical protein UR12_C0012G0005 [candidate division TM6 bacterium GW2011_GWF2_30_66]|nr:MAG: hypothetical protein UR12_C0012G0005 [candidate division TM6 bacterium GW2011_GWF2_30_66]